MTYSPILAIGTALFEVSVAVWAMRGPGRKPIIRTTCAILLLLAAYQIVEVLVCSRAPAYGFMPQMAFIIVTWLPPLGLLLIAQLSPSQSYVNYAISYFMLAVALSIVIWITLDDRFVSDSVCNVVYAKYSSPIPRFQVYSWFYWLGLLGMIVLSALGVRSSDDLDQQRLLKTVLIGSLGFIVPAIIVNQYVAPAQGALPSIMCHFALVLAIFLTRMIAIERRGNLSPISPLIYPLLNISSVREGQTASESVRSRPRLAKSTHRTSTKVPRWDMQRETANLKACKVSARPRGVPRPNRLRITSPRFAPLACIR